MARTTDVERPCPRCEGSGRCVDCGGSGKARCPACEGQGQKVSPRGLTFSCKTCGGTGSIGCPTQCPSCNGSGAITEQFQKEIHEKYTVAFTNYTPSSRAVSVLVALSVVLYLAAPPDLPSLLPQPLPFLVWGTLTNQANSLATMELWRFLTPVFLHAGWWHLAANMWFLISMGPPIEGALGTRRFLALYFLSALGGNVLSWYFNPVPGVGASTALFGVGAAYVGLYLRWRFFDEATARRIGSALLFLLVLGFVLGGFSSFRLDNWGHLGGGLVGLALTGLGPRPRGH